MSTTIYLHGPHKFAASLTGEPGEPDSFASLQTGDASLFLHTRADCDALVKAALAARDMLPDPPPPLSRDLSGDLNAIPSHRIGDPAPLPPGHGPNHIDKMGRATLAVGPCEPGTCTCGGHVTADGVFHAANLEVAR